MTASLPQDELDRLRASLESGEPEAQLAALRALGAAEKEGRHALSSVFTDDIERHGADGWSLALMAYAPTEPALVRSLVSHLDARWAIGPFMGLKQQARDRFVELFALLDREDLEALIGALFPEKGFSDPQWFDSLASIVGPDGMVPLIPKMVERALSDDWGARGASFAFSRAVGPRATACVPYLIELVRAGIGMSNGDQDGVRCNAAQIGAGAVPAVLELLDDHDWRVRSAGRDVLSRMRVLGRSAIADLESALHRAKDAETRTEIEAALERARLVRHPISAREARDLLEGIERGSITLTCAEPNLIAERREHVRIPYSSSDGWEVGVWIRYAMKWRYIHDLRAPDGRVTSYAGEFVPWLGNYHPGPELARLRYGLDE